MIEISNVRLPTGETINKQIASSEERVIDGTGLTLFPGLIDPHVHFRTPGLEHKEDWRTAAKAALRGGITTVFDMPNTLPPTIHKERLHEKKTLIDAQLKEAGIPLRYQLYLGADKSHFDQIHGCKQDVIALKVFMGSSTGGLVMDDESSLHAAFSLAAAAGIPLAVHAEDEQMIHRRTEEFKNHSSPRLHSIIRNHEVAARATQKALELAKLYGTRLYLLHISTKEELALIKKAKEEGVSVLAETTPHHLFLHEEAYDTLGAKAQVNPPLRTQQDNEALWQAIREGVIDTIGSDHAPHTHEEKAKPYPHCPSGMPGIETTLPLLLNAVHSGHLTLQDVVRLMKERIEEFFRLPSHDDWVLVDLEKVKTVEASELQTKCGWSPYGGWVLKGWPVYTILKGHIYAV